MADKINPGSPPRWFGSSALITQQVFSVVLYIYIYIYIYHTYARFLAVRYVIFGYFTKMRSWTQNFSSWASRPKADHDASRGSPSGLPGGLVPPP